jgi:hypothetical protein
MTAELLDFDPEGPASAGPMRSRKASLRFKDLTMQLYCSTFTSSFAWFIRVSMLGT